MLDEEDAAKFLRRLQEQEILLGFVEKRFNREKTIDKVHKEEAREFFHSLHRELERMTQDLLASQQDKGVELETASVHMQCNYLGTVLIGLSATVIESDDMVQQVHNFISGAASGKARADADPEGNKELVREMALELKQKGVLRRHWAREINEKLELLDPPIHLDIKTIKVWIDSTYRTAT